MIIWLVKALEIIRRGVLIEHRVKMEHGVAMLLNAHTHEYGKYTVK
jgi:hypothetical protein